MSKRCHFYRSFISIGIHGVDVFFKVYPSQGINLKSQLIVFVFYLFTYCTVAQMFNFHHNYKKIMFRVVCF